MAQEDINAQAMSIAAHVGTRKTQAKKKAGSDELPAWHFVVPPTGIEPVSQP